jgi:iron complex outermembrane receptor protein
MKKILAMLIILTIITGFLPAIAQDHVGKARGVVLDDAQKPVEAATVSLLKASDSSRLKIVVSDKEGRFLLENLSYGKYLLSISAVGHEKLFTRQFEIRAGQQNFRFDKIVLQTQSNNLKEVSVVAKKSFFEQKADRMIVNVDASPANAGSTVMDILEKSPGVTVDKDGNISLKGKQGVTIMIDNRPTYLSATDLSNYLKSLPASAIDQLEIMTNPSAKYDAAGNSGIINIKTKKNKAKGFNGSVTLTHTQGVYPKPSGSINLNYRNGNVNMFLNAGYSHWEGFQDLTINRQYFNEVGSSKTLNAIFSQQTDLKFINPSVNLKFGMDYYLGKKTTIGFVASGFENSENTNSVSNILLKDPNDIVDSMVYSPSTNKSTWKNGSVNLNFRHQFDSAGTELTADADYIRYNSGSNQYFDNITTYPDNSNRVETILTGNLPSDINIYTFKSDYSHPFEKNLKLEAGVKTSYVATDNNANYFDLVNNISLVDTTKTNHFLYHENINAAYLNMNKQYKKWSVQAGLRLENTIYSGHQLGNSYTVNNNDSFFTRTYTNLFPKLYISYQLNTKNSFSVNYGRRIDRPAYQDLNPFLFFLDNYTYQAGNPYLQPQYTQNIEASHTYNNFLTTTLNYSNTNNFFSETFQQSGYATIVRNGNIGNRKNAGIAVSALLNIRKWWTSMIYTNVNYNKFSGELYGEYLNVSATTLLLNINNQFKFNKGWSAEISGFYRSSGVEGQILVKPMGQLTAAVAKQLFKEKASLKLGIRDILYTQQVRGTIDFQETEASFHNWRDSRQVSLTFTYRFGKPIKGVSQHKNNSSTEEQNRVKVGGNN